MVTAAVEKFTGFPREAIGFLAELRAHNEKPWFEANRATFGSALVAPGRALVADDRGGAELARIVAAVRETGGYEIGGQTYKNVPAQFARDHPQGDLLKHTGLHAERRDSLRPELHSADLVDYVMAHYRRLAPLVTWLAVHI